MLANVTELSDKELNDLADAVYAELSRRQVIDTAARDALDAADRYAQAVANQPAIELSDVPKASAIGPGEHIIIDNIEWINASMTWLSPHTAGPDVYRIGWQKAAPVGEAEAWRPGETVQVSDRRSYESVVYVCIQPHTCQAGWEPPQTPALWTKD